MTDGSEVAAGARQRRKSLSCEAESAKEISWVEKYIDDAIIQINKNTAHLNFFCGKNHTADVSKWR